MSAPERTGCGKNGRRLFRSYSGTSPQTACKRGHPFDAENTLVRLNGTRRCRTCHREGEQARLDRFLAATFDVRRFHGIRMTRRERAAQKAKVLAAAEHWKSVLAGPSR